MGAAQFTVLLYILIHLHVLVSIRLGSHKDCQRQVVKQAIRACVNRAAVSPDAIQDYTVMLKHLLMACVSHACS